MDQIWNEIVTQLTPQIAGIIAMIVGGLLAKFAGIYRSWSLGKRLSGGAKAVEDQILKLEKKGLIDTKLSGILQDILTGFSKNVSQLSKEAIEKLEEFAEILKQKKRA